MDIFPALGLAVLGVFVTIILSGILAGIITFGLIDGRLRREVQARVISTLVDAPVADFLKGDRGKEFFSKDGWWGHRSLYYLSENLRYSSREFNVSLLASLVQHHPYRLFKLPYRQLCGQIANVISAESYGPDQDHDRPSDFQPLTLALAIADIADIADEEDHRLMIRLFSPAFAKTRALAFLDTIQIVLADAVLDRARSLPKLSSPSFSWPS